MAKREVTIYTCDICGTEFQSPNGVNTIILSNDGPFTHDEEKYEHVCKTCYKQVSTYISRLDKRDKAAQQ